MALQNVPKLFTQDKHFDKIPGQRWIGRSGMNHVFDRLPDRLSLPWRAPTGASTRPFRSTSTP
jgi:hypothetical protein